jgi:hypothetical protein
MISGWCTLKDRYAKHCTVLPRRRPGRHRRPRLWRRVPAEWRYLGREQTVFVAERDIQ